MTLLDQIITDAISDTASTASLLRKVIVVAHRLGADEVEAWARAELDGYDDIDAVPKYRANLVTPVMGQWTGPGGSGMTQPIGPGAIPDEERRFLFAASLGQSIDELEQLAALPEDPSIPWDLMHVVRYNKWSEQGLVPHPLYMNLFSARRVVTKGTIRGVLGNVRNTALDLALGLQKADPHAGSLDGPTIEDKAIATTVFHVVNNITGHGTNVAQGSGITQTSTVQARDLIGLLRAAEEAGLSDPEAVRELAAAAAAPESEQQSKFDTFLDRVRSGTWMLTSGVVTGVAVDTLDAAIKGYLGMN